MLRDGSVRRWFIYWGNPYATDKWTMNLMTLLRNSFNESEQQAVCVLALDPEMLLFSMTSVNIASLRPLKRDSALLAKWNARKTAGRM